MPGSDPTVSSPDEFDPEGNPNLSWFDTGIGFMSSIGSGTSPELVPDGGRWLSEEEPLAAALLLTSPWPNLLPIGGLESCRVEKNMVFNQTLLKTLTDKIK